MFTKTRPRLESVAPIHLGASAESAVDRELLGRDGLVARELVAQPPLTITLVALASGGRLPPHRAVGPIALHVLSGALDLHLEGGSRHLRPGDLIALPAGAEHAVEAPSGVRFLLTLVDPGDCPHAG